MKRLWPIVRREYLERVRSKAFVAATVLGPVLMTATTLGPHMLAARQRGRPLRLAVLDATGSLEEPVRSTLSRSEAGGERRFEVDPARSEGLEEARARHRTEVLAGRLDGYLFLPRDALDGGEVEYYGKNVSNLFDLRIMANAVEEALIGTRLARAGLSPDSVKEITRRVSFRPLRLSAAGEREDRGASFVLSLMLVMMLYAALAIWGQAIAIGVIEEKANRVVEVIVSSVRVFDLFVGKLVGIGAAGLTQFLVWGVCLVLLGAYGSGPSTFAGSPLPEVPLSLVAAFNVFFVLGFLLYGALYAAAGATVNSVQEAQSVIVPVSTPLVAAAVISPLIVRDPESTLSVLLSLVPFFTPMLMFLRISVLPPPLWQVLLSVLLNLLTIAAVVWIGSRIYRIGILMYGKRATFPEMMRWIGRA